LKIIIVFDDTGKKSEIITDIIGNKGFADVVVKKRKLEDYYRNILSKLYPCAEWKKIRSQFEYAELYKSLELISEKDVRILHCFSNYFISDEQQALLSIEKLLYIDEVFRAINGRKTVLILFPSVKSYASFSREIISGKKPWDVAKKIKDSFEIKGFIDIGTVGNFIQCITGNFDSRYFNSLKEEEYTLTKSSFNKKKIKSEYCFYHLLPEDMKFWFVMPFNYQENENSASYMMERLHMTDLSIKWVHGSMDKEEFEELMDKYFFFFKSRHTKPCTEEEYEKVAYSLYTQKVKDRLTEFKSLQESFKILSMLSISEEYHIDYLANKYFALKEKIEGKNSYLPISVIGHGDPCFANALYNKSTKILKFIDPKGALTEKELWTNPYYDIAKLSHSICGKYDFFNNALFEIAVNNDFTYNLQIPVDTNYIEYIEIFKKKVQENGYDWLTVRIYEVSLFLSMLPLHMDNQFKVFGFILNIKNLLEEIDMLKEP
jgi:hypothetical protein